MTKIELLISDAAGTFTGQPLR